MFDDYDPDSGFDLRKSRRIEHDSPVPDDPTPNIVGGKVDDLDKPDTMRRHRRLRGLYQREIDRQASNRQEMALDEDFYDSIQWTDEEADEIRERGQVPLVYNVISNSVNWVIGSEKRGRIDFKVLPRRKGEGGPAQRKTELLKYLSDVNRAPFHRSRAFEDCVKVGLGWLEDGLGDDSDSEILSSRYESWRNILWDSASTSMDLKDCRYIFRSKWVDLDFAVAMFPKRRAVIESSAQDAVTYGSSDIEDGDEAMDSQEQSLEQGIGEEYDITRRRVRMIEAWYRVPVTVMRLRGGDFSGEIFDSKDPVHREQLQSGRAEVRQQIMSRMHVAIFVSKGMCWQSESPYRHNDFPFTPIWGYRRGRDNLPYGMIRNLRDIQADINKRASKALAILSSNKIIMEDGSVDDIDEFAEEASRPDAVLVYKKGSQPPVINAERELAAGHVQLMQQGISMVQQASGVTDELLGRKTNAQSGIAIQARQEQGSLATAKFFDNLRLANQIQGEKQLSLVQQFFSEEKSFRITNTRGTPEYVTINDGLPENDIVRTKADFIISEQEWRATMRQAQLDELLNVVSKLAPVAPQVVMVMLDLIVEAMDVPSREELVSRIRQVTGMRDPDAEEMTPEEQQRMQAQQAQQEFQMAMAQAELAIKQADGAKKQAEAQKAAVQALLTQAQTTKANTESQVNAVESAVTVASAPVVAGMADTLLNEAGFISRTESESNMAQASRAQEAEAQAQAEQQAAQEQQQQIAQQQQQQSPGLGGRHVQMLAEGGRVFGIGTATSDSNPAMLSVGEHVINARAADMIGHDTLDRLNQAGMEQKDYGFGKREDGTNKGLGYFGALKRPDGGISTELSIGVEMGGKETQIPALVPTLSRKEVDYLLAGGQPTDAIVQKAADFAKRRIENGLSPFATDGEQTKLPDE